MMPNSQILIVKDEDAAARSLEANLQKLGYVVLPRATSGEQAIRRVDETHPDLILIDIKLQGDPDGIETTARIRTHFDIPVVYLAAHADDETLKRAKETLPFGYIFKPAQIEELHTAIEMALRQHAMEKRLRESEERYRIVSGLTSDYAYAVRVNPDGTLELEWAPEAFIRIADLGLEEQEAVSDWTSIVHSDDIGAALETVQRVLSGQLEELELRIVARSGEEHWLHIHSRPVWDEPQGRVVRIIGAIRDITPRKQAEEELDRYHEHLEELVEQRTAELVAANDRLEREIAERMRAQNALQERAEELSALNALSHRVSTSLSPDEIVEVALEEIIRCTTPDLAMIFLRQGQEDELFLQAVRPETAGYNHSGAKPHHMGQCLCGRAAQEGKPVYSRNIHADPRCTRAECKELGMCSFAALPLLAGKDVLGVLGIASATERDFGEQTTFLEPLAGEIAIGLQNARLHQQVQHHVAELEQEVTEHRRTEEALWESQQLLNKTFASLRDAVFIVDADTLEIIDCNPAVSEMFGYGRQEVLGGTIACLHVDEIAQEEFQGHLHAAVEEQGFLFLPEFSMKRKDGIIFPTAHNVMPLRDEHDLLIGWVSVVRDITEQKRLQTGMIEAEKLAALGRLAASLAHEINNPLQALRSGFRLLLTTQPTQERQQIYLELASHEVERLVAIVERVLGFYRPAREETEPTDVNAILDETLLLTGKQLEHSRIDVHRHFATDLPLAETASDPLKQIFLNLILNAQQAMPDGGELTVQTAWDAESQEVTIAFTDTGIGIPDEHLARIFEPFYTSRPNGTGLGLTVSYSIAERYGGRIEVESEVGVGSTFTVFCKPAERHP